MWSLYTVEYDSARKKAKALALAATCREPENTMLSDRSRHTGCDSNDGKCLKQANPQTENGFLVVSGWKGVGASFGGWNVLDLEVMVAQL